MVSVGLFSVVVVSAVAVVALFSYLLVRRLSDPLDGSKLNSCMSTSAISVALFCVFLIPVDIYIVSGSLDGEGFQTDLDLVESSGDAIRLIYYGLYGTVILFAFLLMPFAYFFFEAEDGEDSTTKKRACSALKYTSGFVVAFVALLSIGLIFKNDKGNTAEDWQGNLGNTFGAGEAILMFLIGCLCVFGLMGWIMYGGYGLASLPLSIMRNAKAPPANIQAHEMDRSSGEVDLELKRTQEQMNYLSSKYEVSGKEWDPKDRRRFITLRSDERKLKAQAEKNAKSGRGKPSSSGPRLDACGRIWNAFAPLRIAVGVALLLLSHLVSISMIISTIDRFLNSTCGYSCGYALDDPSIANPIDEVLKLANKAFPMDFILFALLTVYIFMAIIHGLTQLGVRIAIFKLYDVRRRMTMPHAVLMGMWLVMFTVLVLNMQVLTLSPTYASFGNQFYIPTNGTDVGTKQPCDVSLIGVDEGRCIQTQVGQFINTINAELPFFGVVLFFANLLFLAVFLLSHMLVFCLKDKTHEMEYKRMEDERVWAE